MAKKKKKKGQTMRKFKADELEIGEYPVDWDYYNKWWDEIYEKYFEMTGYVESHVHPDFLGDRLEKANMLFGIMMDYMRKGFEEMKMGPPEEDVQD